jgi:hypothetical protein
LHELIQLNKQRFFRVLENKLMKSSEFVKRMREVIVLPNYYWYEKLFCKTDPKEVTDPVIKKK